MKKSMLAVNALLFLFIMTGCVFFIKYNHVLLKAASSIGFVLAGLINLIYSINKKDANTKYCCFLFAGLVSAMLGDIVLQFNFIGGAILFGIGHIYFYIAQIFIRKIRITDFIFSVILLVLASWYILFFPLMDIKEPAFKAVCLAYSVIISLMSGKSLANAFSKKNAFTIFLCIGCMLFFFSDVCLVTAVFADFWENAIKVCLLTYYPSECILALSLLFAKASTGGKEGSRAIE